MNEALMAEALIGDEAEKFVQSELGRTILGMAKQEVEVAALDLKDCDLKDDKKLREIQNRIWRATQFEAWLVELISKGQEAMQTLAAQQEEN